MCIFLREVSQCEPTWCPQKTNHRHLSQISRPLQNLWKGFVLYIEHFMKSASNLIILQLEMNADRIGKKENMRHSNMRTQINTVLKYEAG